MNSRYKLILEENYCKDKISFTELPKEHREFFCRYLDEAAHLRELDQLYRMMLFNLDNLFEHYQLGFDDSVHNKIGKKVDPVEINAMVCSAVSSAYTLIESMEVFDKVYLSESPDFKSGYISRMYDDSFSYKMIDALRNYMQHGHIPISYDEVHNKIYFDLSEILDVKHLKINSRLKNKLKEVEGQLSEYEVREPCLSCVLMLNEYFMQVHSLYMEFYRYIETSVLKLENVIKAILSQHPEYVIDKDSLNYVGVYLDDQGSLHGFLADCDMDVLYRQNKEYAKTKYEEYKHANGNMLTIRMSYALENRVPLISHIWEEDFSENLQEICCRIFPDIRDLSFDNYYGKMQEYTIYDIYPYIQFEDGLRWNVPYNEVSVNDFLRTFPDAKKNGIEAFANNVGGAGEIFDYLIQQWIHFFESHLTIFQTPSNVLDMIGRISLVYQGYRWLKNSFGSKKAQKPKVWFLEQYIKRQEQWDLKELSKNLHADTELLRLILAECGFLSTDGVIYYFDKETADKIDDAKEMELQKKYNEHGTGVNCYSMNIAVEKLNLNLLYLWVLMHEQNDDNFFEEKAEMFLEPLKGYSDFLYWDKKIKKIQFVDVFPSDFNRDIEQKIFFDVSEINDKMGRECLKLEAS